MGGAKFSKSLIHNFLLMDGAVFPPCCLASGLLEVKWSEVPQSCLTFCDPMDCSLPGSIHEIFQARILEWVAIPPPYLRPNYGEGNEDNGSLLQKIPCMYCYTQCPQPCSRLPPSHASARHSWTLTCKSGSVSCVVTAPFSWVLGDKLLFVPSKSLFLSPV